MFARAALALNYGLQGDPKEFKKIDTALRCKEVKEKIRLDVFKDTNWHPTLDRSFETAEERGNDPTRYTHVWKEDGPRRFPRSKEEQMKLDDENIRNMI